MTISSRTPEGVPNRCPVCDHDFRMEPSLPSGDAPCPACGSLVWFGDTREIALPFIDPEKELDSLEMVEVMMSLEDKFKVEIPDEDYEKIKTVGDIRRYVEERRQR